MAQAAEHYDRVTPCREIVQVGVVFRTAAPAAATLIGSFVRANYLKAKSKLCVKFERISCLGKFERNYFCEI